MKLFLIFCFSVLFPYLVWPQSEGLSTAYGAKSQGMGGVKLFHPDSWTLFNSIGNLDRVSSSQVAVGIDQRFGIKELSTYALSHVFHQTKGSLGYGISRYGGELFNQHLLSLGGATTKGILSFGAKAEWMQTRIEGFGTGNAFLLSLGGVAELGPKFFLGSQISNLTQARISKNSSISLPTSILLGLKYLASPEVEIHSEVEKELSTPPLFKAGVQYKLGEWLLLRTGMQSNPARINFGLGIRKSSFGADYAYGQTSALGRSHHMSLYLEF
ncbi:MAG: hypothetical protein FJZ76_10155 [Bacteroidetes bacterium]|nr:hypothetical protein [Bacteroidota bacterium]